MLWKPMFHVLKTLFGLLLRLPPVWSTPTPSSCLIHSYPFLLSDPLLRLPPVWSTPTPSSCLIHSYPFLLSDPLLPLPPVWSTPTPLYHSLMLFICNKNNMSPSLVVLCLMVTNLYLSVFVVSFVNDNHVREFVNNV
jgi:hypothetical protein